MPFYFRQYVRKLHCFVQTQQKGQDFNGLSDIKVKQQKAGEQNYKCEENNGKKEDRRMNFAVGIDY